MEPELIASITSCSFHYIARSQNFNSGHFRITSDPETKDIKQLPFEIEIDSLQFYN